MRHIRLMPLRKEFDGDEVFVVESPYRFKSVMCRVETVSSQEGNCWIGLHSYSDDTISLSLHEYDPSAPQRFIAEFFVVDVSHEQLPKFVRMIADLMIERKTENA